MLAFMLSLFLRGGPDRPPCPKPPPAPTCFSEFSDCRESMGARSKLCVVLLKQCVKKEVGSR
jgi:hypothetical protein